MSGHQSDATARPLTPWNSIKGRQVQLSAQLKQLENPRLTRMEAFGAAENACGVTVEHRERYADPNSVPPLGLRPHEKWFGNEFTRARDEYGFEQYDEIVRLAASEGKRARLMTDLEIEGLLFRTNARQRRPDLWPPKEKAESLNQWLDAARVERPHASEAEFVKLAQKDAAGLVIEHYRSYGSRQAAPDAAGPVQLSAQTEANAVQGWCDSAVEDWRSRHGGHEPTGRERAECFSTYATRNPGAVPDSIRWQFRLGPQPTTTTLTRLVALDAGQPATAPASPDPRIQCALGAVDRQEREYVAQWTAAAKRWWAQQEDGNDNEAEAVERFARAFPELTPDIIASMFDGLRTEVRRAERAAKREGNS